MCLTKGMREGRKPAMPFSVQLDVDADTEAILGALADRLAPLSGLKTVRQIGVVHHLSLGVYGELPTDRFLPALAKFAETLPPLVVRPANLGVFPGGVLFFAPVVTSELLEVHRRFHAEFSSFSDSCFEHYRPGQWVPHVTLVLNASPGALETAVGRIMSCWSPATARLEVLRLIAFPPARTLFRCKLGSEFEAPR
jgi:2'-5' RNA ligase